MAVERGSTLKGASNWTGPGITFSDGWEMWNETEAHYGCTLEVRLWPPRRTKSGTLLQARVGVTATWAPASPTKPLTRFCDIGGTRGASTVPAALVRALAELQAALDERAESAAQQAMF